MGEKWTALQYTNNGKNVNRTGKSNGERQTSKFQIKLRETEHEPVLLEPPPPLPSETQTPQQNTVKKTYEISDETVRLFYK